MTTLLSLSIVLLILLQIFRVIPFARIIYDYIKQCFIKKQDCVYSIHTILKAIISESIAIILMISCICSSGKGVLLKYTTATQIAYSIFDVYYLLCLAFFCYRSFSDSISQISKTSHVLVHLVSELMIICTMFFFLSDKGTLSSSYATSSAFDFIENFFTNTGSQKIDAFIFGIYFIMVASISIIHLVYMNKYSRRNHNEIVYSIPIIMIFALLSRATVGLGGLFLDGHYLFAFAFYLIRISLEFYTLNKISKYIEEEGLN